MKHHRRTGALALALVLLLLCCPLSGCGATAAQGAGPAEPIVLNEPQYVGEDDDGYPVFRFTWSKVRNLWYYDMAIYLELDGYAERSRVSFTDKNATSAEIPFLKGIDADTATYRIKIRPLLTGDGSDAWSDVWRIDFVNGVYTVTSGAPDFDAPKPSPAPSAQTGGTPAGDGAPVEHTFPESLLVYAAKERQTERIDLTDAAVLSVQVNHCEYGEPTQTITDAATVAAAAEAVSNITVTGGSDGISSTGTHYNFQFSDAAGNTLAWFGFQDGMLMEDDGRYPVSGLEALYDVRGIMLSDAWDAYWRAESEKQDRYAQQFQPSYPETVFALSGYNASLLDGIDPANIGFIRVRVSWNDYAGTLEARDPAVIRALYEALAAMRVTGPARTNEPSGQEWSVYLSFQSPEPSDDLVPQNTYLSFRGDFLLSDLLDGGSEAPYQLEGLEAFFDCTDADVLQYLKEKRNTVKSEPKYS